MEVQFYFVRTNSGITSRFDLLASLLKNSDLDSLRQTPDPAMEAFARELSELLGTEFAPTRVITASVHSQNAYALNFIFITCLQYGVSAFIGQSDLYIDASGVNGATDEISALTNSLGTAWYQVSEHTVDRAFEDALRAPSDKDTWVQVFNFGASRAEFGYRMRMHLLEDGRFKVVWTMREDGTEARLHVAANYEEASALLLAFADHSPTLNEYEWTRVGAVPHAYSCDLVQRSQYRLRRFGAIRQLPAGVMMRLHDRLNFSLEFGRDSEGQWRATMRHALNGGMTRTFDTADELVSVAEAYVNDELGVLLEFFPESSEMAAPRELQVTAMVLPEREVRWANSSVREMHRVRAKRNDAADETMMVFIEKVNLQAPHVLALEGERIEPRALSTITVRTRGSIRTLDRLSNLAQRHGVSLVLEDNQVLVNPSGVTPGGDVRTTLELFDGVRCTNRWAAVTPAALMEATMVDYRDWQQRLTVEPIAHTDQRLVLIATPENSSLTSFTLKAYGPGWSVRSVSEVPQHYMGLMFTTAATSPDELIDSVKWGGVRTIDLTLPMRPFMLSSSLGQSPTMLDDAALEKCQETFANADVGDWIGVTDNRSPLDYCRVIRHDDQGWYRVEWGYNDGVVERGHVLTNDLNRAYEIFRMYVEDNRELMAALDWIVGSAESTDDNDPDVPEASRSSSTERLYFVRPSPSVLANHQKYVQEFYSQDHEQLQVPDASMSELASALQQLLGQEVEPRRRLACNANLDDSDLLEEIISLACQHRVLVFHEASGLLVNGCGYDIHEASFTGVRNCIGSTWRQVDARTVDLAFEDALRVSDPIGIWIDVFTHAGDAMGAQLEADGTWSIHWRVRDEETPHAQRVFTCVVASYALARELLLAFADRSPLLAKLTWSEATHTDGQFTARVGERSNLPLRRLDAVSALPEGTFVRLHDGPAGALEYGRARNGRWVAALETQPLTSVTREFSSAIDLVAFVQTYLTSDESQVEALFGEDVPVETHSLWDNDTTEITAMILPQRAQAWTDSAVLHFHRVHAETAVDAPAQLKAFFADLQQVQASPGNIRGRAGNEVGLRALTRVWVPQAALVDVLSEIATIAPRYGVSVVLNGTHVFCNATCGAETQFSGLTLSWNDRFVQNWADVTAPAFAQGLQQLPRASALVFVSAIQLASHQTEPDLQFYSLTVLNELGGFSAKYEIPGDIEYTVEGLEEHDVLHLYATMVESPALVIDAAAWHSPRRSPEASARFEMQSNLFEPMPLSVENLDALRRVDLPKKGDFIQVLDSAVEGDYVLAINDGGALRTKFRVGWGHDFGQIENYSRTTRNLDEALALVEHYVAGNRQEFVALGWKRRKVR